MHGSATSRVEKVKSEQKLIMVPVSGEQPSEESGFPREERQEAGSQGEKCCPIGDGSGESSGNNPSEVAA